MQSSSFSLSKPKPFLKTLTSPNPNSPCSSSLRFNTHDPLKPLNIVAINGFSSQSCPRLLRFNCVKSIASLVSDEEKRAIGFVGSGPEEEEVIVGETKDSTSSVVRTVELGVLLGFWYLFNIYFNIYNKQVLEVFPYPVTITAFQFAFGSVFIHFMWAFNLHKKPKVTKSQLVTIIPLAILHTLGNLFTNMSLGKVSVSFTHTIKAMEPFFSVVLSAMYLGEEPLDNITIFSIITIMSFLIVAPVTPIIEGFRFTPSYLQSAGLNIKEVCVRSLIAGFCFHAYQQASHTFLINS
ncbi:hypothetical protein GIB67_017694 [Kingdonia uniflora]|uniref:Sugar phosphate transporter domain-containing protein n=1 Tax=Kingdonia uniflora TaxID=39325 RepID=A0A7J7NAR3_9MAGN|nr:hypothetical protein GIB67_017694 [Kingdonia uniflora]